MTNVGFIGLGAMGLPMARNLHNKGLLTHVWNRSTDKADAFARDTGCTVSPTAAALAAESDVVILCVSADTDVLEVVETIAASLRDGSVVIDCSTVAAKTARQAAAIIETGDRGFIDCPVSGGTEGALAGVLSIMAGGAERWVDRARPVLDAMGTTVVHMGAVGSGQAAKAVNQIMIAGINQAVSEALAFGQSQNLEIPPLIEALSGGAAANWFLTHRGPNMHRKEFPLGFKVELHAKDLRIARDMAEEHDVRLPVVEMTLLHYKRLIGDGFGSEDVSSLFRLKSDLFTHD